MKSPKALYLLPTLKCNLKCRMCDSGLDYPTDDILTADDYDKFFRTLGFRKPYLYIGGGEPILYPHLSGLLDVIKKHKMEVILNTNGILLDKLVSNITKMNVLIVSLDGIEEDHNAIRGKDIYRRVVDNIRLIKKISNIKITISTVMVPQTYKHYEQFLDEVDTLGIDNVTIHTLKHITTERLEAQKKYIAEHFGEGHYLFPKMRLWDNPDFDMEIYADQIKKIEANRHKYTFKIRYSRAFTPQMMIDYHTDKFYDYLKDLRCYNIHNTLTIYPDGNMASCSNYILGNIKKDKLRAVWNSKLAKEFRIKHRNKYFPACFGCGGFGKD